MHKESSITCAQFFVTGSLRKRRTFLKAPSAILGVTIVVMVNRMTGSNAEIMLLARLGRLSGGSDDGVNVSGTGLLIRRSVLENRGPAIITVGMAMIIP